MRIDCKTVIILYLTISCSSKPIHCDHTAFPNCHELPNGHRFLASAIRKIAWSQHSAMRGGSRLEPHPPLSWPMCRAIVPCDLPDLRLVSLSSSSLSVRMSCDRLAPVADGKMVPPNQRLVYTPPSWYRKSFSPAKPIISRPTMNMPPIAAFLSYFIQLHVPSFPLDFPLFLFKFISVASAKRIFCFARVYTSIFRQCGSGNTRMSP